MTVDRVSGVRMVPGRHWAKLKRDVRKRLLLDKGAVKNNVAKEMYDLRAKSNIDIKDKVFADAYARFMEAYKKDIALKGGGN